MDTQMISAGLLAGLKGGVSSSYSSPLTSCQEAAWCTGSSQGHHSLEELMNATLLQADLSWRSPSSAAGASVLVGVRFELIFARCRHFKTKGVCCLTHGRRPLVGDNSCLSAMMKSALVTIWEVKCQPSLSPFPSSS